MFVPILEFLNIPSSGNIWIDMRDFGNNLKKSSPSFLERQTMKAIFDIYNKVFFIIIIYI